MATIVVIGAGPAGAAAGCHLARAGHHVTLLDKAAFPRPKTCGDWVTQGAVAEIDRLGLGTELRRLAARHATVDTTLLSAPSQLASVVAHASPAYCIPRHALDDLLCRTAVAAGCRLERRHVRDLDRTWRDAFPEADHVVDARGVYGGRPNSVAIRAYWRVPAPAVAPDDRRRIRIFTDARHRMGYSWIFPTAIATDVIELNVGLGVWKEEYDRTEGTISEAFATFARHHPVAAPLAARALERGRPVGHHLALAGAPLDPAPDGLLKIGDAANLTDPVTGEGIGQAVLSGRLVAEAIHGAATPAAAPDRWRQACGAAFHDHVRAAVRVRHALAGTWRKNVAARLLRACPPLERRLHESICGLRSYADLLVVPGWRTREATS